MPIVNSILLYQPMLWTFSEFIWTRDLPWIVRWPNSAKFAISISVGYEPTTKPIDHQESLLTLVRPCDRHESESTTATTSYLLDRLQSVLNSATRLVMNISMFSNISATIRDEFYWPLIKKRIVSKPRSPSCSTLNGGCCAGVSIEAVPSMSAAQSTRSPISFS